MEKQDQISPLIQQAKLFALLINPPPPPKPPKPKVTTKKVTTQTVKPPPPPTPKVQHVTAKFKLLGTCRYEQSPELSFALLDLGGNKQKWVQQGQVVEHLTIQEIKDGSIVTFKNGRFNNELAMQNAKSQIKSLLKSDYSGVQLPVTTGTPFVEASTPPVPKTPAYEVEKIEPKPLPSVRPSPKPQQRKPVPRRTTGRRTIPSISRSGQSTRTRKPLPEPTPQERKKSLDDTIVGIKEIMKEPPKEGVTEAQKAEERKAWNQLLNILQQERSEVEGEIDNKSDDSQNPPK